MNNAILLHGSCDKEEYFDEKYPALSNSHWFPWLQKQLLMKNITTQTPEMPVAFAPNYANWKLEFERLLINEDTILVGHSCGGGFILRWLSENKIEVGNVVLVAPWLDPDRVKTTDFFDFEIDPTISDRIKRLALFVSDDDESDILKSVEIIKNSLKDINIIRFENMGHFTLDVMKKYDFSELLEEVLKV